MPEDMSDRMPEDLPVTKRINVMVGITRSKVIHFLKRVFHSGVWIAFVLGVARRSYIFTSKFGS